VNHWSQLYQEWAALLEAVGDCVAPAILVVLVTSFVGLTATLWIMILQPSITVGVMFSFFAWIWMSRPWLLSYFAEKAFDDVCSKKKKQQTHTHTYIEFKRNNAS
jgi:hypothetical protein